MTNIIVFNLILAATCGYALVVGGAPERAAALVFVTAAVVTFLIPNDDYQSVASAVLLIDFCTFVAMTAIALKANRFWPLYESSLLLITLAVHGVKAYQPTFAYWMYHGAVGKMAYPTLILLVVGVLRHRRRVAAYGADRDWSHSQKHKLAY